MDNETIVAIATPPGRGGVGIVRLSGKEAYPIALKLTHKPTLLPRQAIYCAFYYDEILIDKGIVLFFNTPHSFTGEDVIELHAHGSPIVLDQLVQQCVLLGARTARPGEFSERAFLNDKMDLTQAEAIADLINASSKTAARMAVKSLQGEFSARIHTFNDKLIQLRLYVEAAIDFPDEEIDFLSDGKIENMLNGLLAELQIIRRSAAQGVIMREGLSVVIAGKPNAGKSTLINALAGRDIAIVTEIAGTTRDVMREYILIDDIPIHIIDTAGLRESTDPVEQEGIRRAWLELERADCVLLVIDSNEENCSDILNAEIKNRLPHEVPILSLYNKIDKNKGEVRVKGQAIYLSAMLGLGLDLLKSKIKEIVGFQEGEGQFLARRRHIEALDESLEYLLKGHHQLCEFKAGELLAEDLRLAHESLCQITGEFSSDDLLGKIFSSFCIGK